MAHIVLLGDSIFDNAAYVPGGPDVVLQVRDIVPQGWQASLLAVDGAVTSGVASQLKRVPADATHLALSVGGNDALGFSYLLGESVRSVGEGVVLLEQAQRRFAGQYRDMLEGVLALDLPTAVCTIYDTPPSAPNHRIIRAALALFNDEISRAAFSLGLTLIDLRLICNEEGDYANPIEPSVQGGAKMASAILEFARDSAASRSRVIAAPEPN
ncbi:MAG TPA: SGNH/GDSL hydrolase family protein [Allosphingosinicella sp.]|jgi:hypothetical protein